MYGDGPAEPAGPPRPQPGPTAAPRYDTGPAARHAPAPGPAGGPATAPGSASVTAPGAAPPPYDTGPHPVRHDDLLVPLSDGTLLHARLWRPRTGAPAPVLLEYAPGRLTDTTTARDARRHPWYASHGYASVRVDARGHGCGEGVPAAPWGGPDRGPAQDAAADAADAAEVVEWLAAQPWGDGRIGMFGLGPGATLALRVAVLAPDPLRAVVAVGATVDPYQEDGAHLGGTVAADALHARSTALLSALCRPPDPRYAGADVWRDRWTARLAAVAPPLHGALAHPLRDDHWPGWTGADAGAVRAAVLAVGGWYDPARDTVLRLLETLPADRVRGLIGPWARHYPDEPGPGPAIGFLHETLRWWDHHLRGAASAPVPPLRAWITTPADPANTETGTHTAAPEGPEGPVPGTRASGWVTEPAWPSPAVRTVPHILRGDPVPVASPAHTGADAGRPLPEPGRTADLPPDQREEDARSVCFEFPVPGDGLTVLGRPRVTLRLRLDVPYGRIAVRLCDLAPDGSSALITRGVRNTAARDGLDRARAWPPGAVEDVSFDLAAAGYAVPPGHRLRLAVSSAYWPWLWPPAGPPAEFVLFPEGSRLDLPVRDPDPPGTPPVALGPPERVEPLGVVSPAPLTAPAGRRPEHALIRDVGTGTWRLETDPRPLGADGASRVHPDGLEVFEDAREIRTIRAGDPLSARAETEWTVRFHRPDLGWDITVETRSALYCDADDLVAEDEVSCRDNAAGPGHRGEPVFHRSWVKRFPRTAG
ncbi:CocE/NonD family hydrolase [Streptomyces sp. NPDC006798]|uniref:CocE/NonD family hydrolase n=1 Tax=Streptomyces sp. NPDC006798 TaxID=3155462 RepID=UPI0033C84787